MEATGRETDEIRRRNAANSEQGPERRRGRRIAKSLGVAAIAAAITTVYMYKDWSGERQEIAAKTEGYLESGGVLTDADFDITFDKAVFVKRLTEGADDRYRIFLPCPDSDEAGPAGFAFKLDTPPANDPVDEINIQITNRVQDADGRSLQVETEELNLLDPEGAEEIKRLIASGCAFTEP